MPVYIGDVHGKFDAYKQLIKRHTGTIQIGDMGVGFRRLVPGDHYEGVAYARNPPFDLMVKGGHRFIRGNHDNPAVCKKHKQFIPDGTVEGDKMFIGGALSIDREWRTEGFDWWPDEELSIQELNGLLDVYAVTQPRVMVTHECPESVAEAICKARNQAKYDLPSRTRQAFQAMLESHRPEAWVFGHWHFSFDAVIDGTRFVCLNELEAKDIP